jgi:hypothetical protein
MSVTGHIQNGVVVLDTPNVLPEGTAVKVEAIAAGEQPQTRSLLDRVGDVVGKAEGLPADAVQVGGSQMSTCGDRLSGSRAQAFAIRAAWMRKMGFSDEEIKEACLDDGSPINLEGEQENLRCAHELKDVTPPIAVLKSWAIQR